MAVELESRNGPGAFGPKVGEHPPLDDPEQGLVVPPFGRPAPLGPAVGQEHGLAGVVIGRRVGGAFIEGHNDVGPQGLLDGDSLLGAQEVLGAVEVALKHDAVRGDLP